MNEVVVEFGAPRVPRISGPEFPSVELGDALPPGADQLRVDPGTWRAGDIDFYALDAEADALGERGLVPVAAAGPPGARLELLTRCQRWLDRRNRRSSGCAFDSVLALHRCLHDRERPLVRADHNHALDTWQWVLRLDPDAGAGLQIAALFHDVERLDSEAERRVEHRAARYDLFKQRHAELGARRIAALLASLSSLGTAVARAAELVAAGDRPAGSTDPELATLEDADALSFFSLNSGGFLDYYGERHTARKIAWTLPRLSRRGLAELARVRLRRDVARLLSSHAGAGGVHP